MTWWRSLSVLLCILTALVSPRTASGASAVQAETRVKAFFLVATALVGGSTARTVEKHPGNAVAYDENASGYALAAEEELFGEGTVGAARAKGAVGDVKIIDQLKGAGQLRNLRTNPNLRGVNIEELLQKTPDELQDMVKSGDLDKRMLRLIMKAFEGRNLGG